MAAQKILLLLLLFMSIKALSTLVSTNETSEKREARSNLRVCNSIRATIQQQLTGCHYLLAIISGSWGGGSPLNHFAIITTPPLLHNDRKSTLFRSPTNYIYASCGFYSRRWLNRQS